MCFLMSKTRLDQMDILQRKMIKRFGSWRRNEHEDWHITMTRMKTRMLRAHESYTWKAWSHAYAKNQWNFIMHILNSENIPWSREFCKFNFQAIKKCPPRTNKSTKHVA